MFSLGHCQLPSEELPALLGAGQEWEQSEVKEGKAGHGGYSAGLLPVVRTFLEKAIQ